jgi:hypothetical protein
MKMYIHLSAAVSMLFGLVVFTEGLAISGGSGPWGLFSVVVSCQ